MNSTERLFALKVSLIMSVRMLGLFMLFPVMSVYASDYDSSTPFLIGIAIGIYGLTQALLMPEHHPPPGEPRGHLSTQTNILTTPHSLPLILQHSQRR